MSTRSVSSRPRASSRPRRRPARARRQVVRRRLLLLGAVIAAAIAVPALIAPFADRAVQEVTLPLRHDDIIRQQAEDKGLDASLIAAVLYTESRSRDQTSHAGAGKVDEWWSIAQARGEPFRVASNIPFPETRDYVGKVLDTRTRYRKEY